jgi:hypothetical protein
MGMTEEHARFIGMLNKYVALLDVSVAGFSLFFDESSYTDYDEAVLIKCFQLVLLGRDLQV